METASQVANVLDHHNLLGSGQPSSGLPRRERCRKVKGGSRLPALVFLPVLCMAMTTHVIMVPNSKTTPCPVPTVGKVSRQIGQFGRHAYHQVSYLDEIVMLDWGMWLKFNKLKATYLIQGLKAAVISRETSSKDTEEVLTSRNLGQ